MYSLLIVDDEPLIRRGISKILNWKELGVDRIYEAGNGKEALDIVRNNQIDLVLTDIVMPFMDGIALAKELHSEFPKIQVVIASGHEDFEYARQSVDLGVCSYILKPMGAKTLFAKMSEIITGIRKQDEKQQYFNEMRAQLRNHMPIVQERYLNEIVCMKHGDKNQLVRQGASVGLDFSSKQYIVAVLNLELDSIPDEDIPLYMFSCKNIVHDCIGNRHNIFAPNSYKKLVILFHCDVLGDEPKDIVYQTMEVILKALDLTIHVKATGGIGTLAEGVEQLPSSFYAARRACEFRFSLGNNVVYDIGDRMLQPGVFNYPAEDVKVLLHAIRFGDREAICGAVQEVRKYIQNEEKLSGNNVRIVLSEIVTDILKDISEMPEVSAGMISQCMQLYSEISQMSSLEDMMDQIQHTALAVSEEYHKAEKTSSHALILKVKECVEKN
ncbi:MAG: response regulator [Eubacterium sp.]|nr:response regulator [Eubacterium sp.]